MEADAGDGAVAGDQLAVIEERAGSEDAASAQSTGKIDPQAPGWAKMRSDIDEGWTTDVEISEEVHEGSDGEVSQGIRGHACASC